jgi:hypothetical protein
VKSRKNKPKVIKYHPYSAAKMEDNVVYVLERDIDVNANEIIADFENDLNKHNIKFIKKKLGKYYRYWIVFNFFL